MIIATTDFKGRYAIGQDQFTREQLENFIDENEKKYLRQLLGVELTKLFLADLSNGVPQSQRFIDIFNPFAEDIESGKVFFNTFSVSFEFFFCCDNNRKYIESEGLKQYLVAMIYFEYVRTFVANPAIQSMVSRDESNSDTADYNGLWNHNLYNNGIETGKAIQWKCSDKSTDYPEFKGSWLNFNTPI